MQVHAKVFVLLDPVLHLDAPSDNGKDLLVDNVISRGRDTWSFDDRLSMVDGGGSRKSRTIAPSHTEQGDR